MIAALIALLAAGALPQAAIAEPTAAAGADDVPRALATANDQAMRMTVPATVNGQGPFAFTIDTGADRSVLSDRLASALALPDGGAVIVHGIIGPEMVRTVKVDRLRIGAHERRDIAAPVLPERALGAEGFLGIDALADQAVVLDFKRRRITMTRSADDRGDPETIVVTGRSRFGQLILTDARIGRRKVYAIIDTGAQGSVANPEMRRLLLGAATIAPNNSLLGVTGAEIPAENGMIARIELGGLIVTNMPIVFADAHTFRKFGVDGVPAILVGMDMLRRFDRVAVDFRRREVRFLVGDGGIAPAGAADRGRTLAAANAPGALRP